MGMEDCTWCSGEGIIRKSYSLKELNIIEWAFVLGSFFTVMIFLQWFGKNNGLTALMLVLGLVILIPAIQIGFWIFGTMGVITKKSPCPHCISDNSGNVSKDV